MIFLKRKPLSRRTLLKGGGVTLALPMLEAMLASKASAQDDAKYFFGFFYPNGTSPNEWEPNGTGATANNLSTCLQDLKGFDKEGIWPACSSLASEVTVVKNLHHDMYGAGIHSPNLALQAHAVDGDQQISAPSLDQKIAQKAENRSAFSNLAMASTSDDSLGQGFISWRDGRVPADVDRSPKNLFNRLFGASQGSVAEAKIAARKRGLLDFLREDIKALNQKVSVGDRQRVEHFLTSIEELEGQIRDPEGGACLFEPFDITEDNWHDKSKLFIDIAVLAMSCDLTRVATLQYSNSWGVNYRDYILGDGQVDAAGTVGVGPYSDHFISHKIGDRDSAKDLAALPTAQARAIADNRVVLTSRFKVRRFAYLIDKLRTTETPTGNLLDQALALYCSEIGNGDSHNLRRRPTLLAGRAGGFVPGRVIDAEGASTAALHGAILNRFGYSLERYGNPAASPLGNI